MELLVTGSAHVARGSSEVININYSEARDRTIVSIDADIITLGLAAEILTTRFKQALVKLNPALQEQIAEGVRKVADEHCEINRSECIVSRPNSGQ